MFGFVLNACRMDGNQSKRQFLFSVCVMVQIVCLMVVHALEKVKDKELA